MNTAIETNRGKVGPSENINSLPHFLVDIGSGTVTNGTAQIPPFRQGFLLDVLEKFSEGAPTFEELAKLAEEHGLMFDRQSITQRLGGLRIKLGQGPDLIKPGKREDGTPIFVFNGTIDITGQRTISQDDQNFGTVLQEGEVQDVQVPQKPTLPSMGIDARTRKVTFGDKETKLKKPFFKILNELGTNGRLLYQDAQRIARENGLEISPVDLSMEISKLSKRIGGEGSRLIQLRDIEGERFYVLNATAQIATDIQRPLTTPVQKQEARTPREKIVAPLSLDQRLAVVSENAPTIVIDAENAQIRVGNERIKFYSPTYWRIFLNLAVNNGKILRQADFNGMGERKASVAQNISNLRNYLGDQSRLIKNDAANTREGGKWRLDANVVFLTPPPEDIKTAQTKQLAKKGKELSQARKEQRELLKSQLLQRAPDAIREKLREAIASFGTTEIKVYLHIPFTRSEAFTRKDWGEKAYPDLPEAKALQNISAIISRTRLSLRASGLEIAKIIEKSFPHFLYLKDSSATDTSPLPPALVALREAAEKDIERKSSRPARRRSDTTPRQPREPRGEKRTPTKRAPVLRRKRLEKGEGNAKTSGEKEAATRTAEKKATAEAKAKKEITAFEERILDFMGTREVSRDQLLQFFEGKKNLFHEKKERLVDSIVIRINGKLSNGDRIIRIVDPNTEEVSFRRSKIEPIKEDEKPEDTDIKKDTHFHRWKIGEANGPTSEGRCECGKTKIFKNFIDAITSSEIKLNI